MAVPARPRKFCDNCGAENNPKNSVCGSCGAPMASPVGSSDYRSLEGLSDLGKRSSPLGEPSIGRIRSLSAEPMREALAGRSARRRSGASADSGPICLATYPVGYRRGGRARHGEAGRFRRGARRGGVREGAPHTRASWHRWLFEARSAYHLYRPPSVRPPARGKLGAVAPRADIRGLRARSHLGLGY